MGVDGTDGMDVCGWHRLHGWAQMGADGVDRHRWVWMAQNDADGCRLVQIGTDGTEWCEWAWMGMYGTDGCRWA